MTNPQAMQIPPMRPTFRVQAPLPAQNAIDRISGLISASDHPVEGRIAGNHLMLVIPPASRHFWSPWLNIEVHEHESGSMVMGRFSPNPSVWTAFMLTYIALATLVFFAAMFGVAQWMMDRPPGALKLIPLLLAIAVAMYWASLVGQKLARAQMHELYDATMRVLSGYDAPMPEPADTAKSNSNTGTSGPV